VFGAEQRDIDQIAEYADSSIRQMVRTGSLAPIAGRTGLNRWLYQKWGNRGNAIYTAVGSLLTIGLSGLLAWALSEPLVFPSLGATAFLFFETPMAEVASIRNTVIGHLVGTLVGFFWLNVFGFVGDPSAIVTGFDAQRVACVALSLAGTGGILRLLRAAHPPAGATTVIVSVGLLTTVHQIAILMAGVLILSAAAWGLNRLMGVPAPMWTGAPVKLPWKRRAATVEPAPVRHR
jgi:CBS-domain-containing membrane protein